MDTTHHHHETTHAMHNSTEDHSGHTSPHHSMKMFFHSDYEGLVVLFESLQVKSDGGLAGACICLFLLAVFYEGLKVARAWHIALSYRPRPPAVQVLNGTYLDSSKSSFMSSSRSSKFDVHHILESLLYLVQTSVSYVLMLAVMTFQLWLCVSVVLGAAIGYLAFAWKRPTQGSVDTSDHCH